MKTARFAVAQFILTMMVAVSLAGCGGGGFSPTTNDAAPPSFSAPTLAQLTAGLTPGPASALLDQLAPADNDVAPMGGVSTLIHPQRWNETTRTWTAVPAFAPGRFITPSGAFRFGANAIVKNGNGKLTPVAGTIFQLYGGLYQAAKNGATPILLFVSDGGGRPLLRPVPTSLTSGLELAIKGVNYVVAPGSSFIVLPAWYNLAGKRVGPPAGRLTFTPYWDSEMMSYQGNQVFEVEVGAVGTMSVGLTIRQVGKDHPAPSWYSSVRLITAGPPPISNSIG